VNCGLVLVRVSIVAVIAMLYCMPASAYQTCKTASGKDIKWSSASAAYYINTSGGPAGSVDSIVAGMQTWTDVASSNFDFAYGGATTSTNHGTNDGVNIVTFGALDVGTVGENRYWYSTVTGRMLDSDIRLNTYYSWSTTGDPGAFDVQNVSTHELGHSLCLKDLYSGGDSEKTMYGYVAAGETKKQTLEQDDMDGIAYLYACPNLPVRISGTPFEYYSLQDAYDAASDGDVILSQAVVFAEDLFIDDPGNKSITIEGGYDCGYSLQIGKTAVNGNLIITKGALFIDNIELW